MSVPSLTAELAPTSFARGVSWSAISQIWSFALSLVSAVILSRLLLPSDYAVLAVVAPVVGIAQNLQALGFGHAIIQAQEISKQQLDALFASSFVLSLLLAFVVIVCAPLVADFAEDPRISSAMIVASISIIALALVWQPSTLLARRHHFRAIAIRNIGSSTLGALATIGVAFYTRSYWALIVGMLLIPSLNFAFSVKLAHWRPGMPKRTSGYEKMLRFSFTMWVTNQFNFVSRNADNLIVAHATSVHELGIYDRSYRVLLYPIGQAVLPLGQVLIPTLSRNLDDPIRYRDYYWRAMILLLVACSPGLALVVIYPATIMGILLGPEWLEGSELFRWFAAAGIFQTYLTTTRWLFISQARGRDLMYSGLISSVVALGSFLIGIRWGIEGVALAYLISQVFITTPITLWFAGRTGAVDYANLCSGTIPHALGIFVVLSLLWLLKVAFGHPLWPQLLMIGFGAYLTYAVALFAWPSSRRLIREMASRVLAAFGQALGIAE